MYPLSSRAREAARCRPERVKPLAVIPSARSRSLSSRARAASEGPAGLAEIPAWQMGPSVAPLLRDDIPEAGYGLIMFPLSGPLGCSDALYM